MFNCINWIYICPDVLITCGLYRLKQIIPFVCTYSDIRSYHVLCPRSVGTSSISSLADAYWYFKVSFGCIEWFFLGPTTVPANNNILLILSLCSCAVKSVGCSICPHQCWCILSFQLFIFWLWLQPNLTYALSNSLDPKVNRHQLRASRLEAFHENDVRTGKELKAAENGRHELRQQVYELNQLLIEI